MPVVVKSPRAAPADLADFDWARPRRALRTLSGPVYQN
jgi:hypothetical protein